MVIPEDIFANVYYNFKCSYSIIQKLHFLTPTLNKGRQRKEAPRPSRIWVPRSLMIRNEVHGQSLIFSPLWPAQRTRLGTQLQFLWPDIPVVTASLGLNSSILQHQAQTLYRTRVLPMIASLSLAFCQWLNN